MKHAGILFVLGILGIIATLAACSSSSNNPTPTTVIISGTLATTTSAAMTAAKAQGIPLKATAAPGYMLHVVNATDNTQAYVSSDANGSVSTTVHSGDSVLMTLVDSNYREIGPVVIEAGAGDSTIGLSATGDAAIINLGEIVGNTDTNNVTISEDASDYANNDYMGEASGGVLTGAAGCGDLNTGINQTFARAQSGSGDSAADTDGDGRPDIVDCDDDNNGIRDDQAGITFAGCSGIDQITLFTDNKRNIADVLDVATGTNYVITHHLFPASPKNIDSVTVSGPSYLGSLLIQDSPFYNTAIANNTPWNRELVPCTFDGSANHCIFIKGDGADVLATTMAAGDLFVYDITFADGTTTTCTRMINSVLNLTFQNPRVGDDDASASGDFSDIDTNWLDFTTIDVDGDGKVKIRYDIPAGMQLGFTHRFDAFGYDAGCSLGDEAALIDMRDMDPTFTGDTRTSALDAEADVDVILDWSYADWPASAVNAWSFDLTAQDAVGDNSAIYGIKSYVGGGAAPCP